MSMINGSNHYTSQLAVILKPEMDEIFIECAYDNGTTATLVGSTKLNINTSITCMPSISHSEYIILTNTTSIYMHMGILKGT